MPMNIPLVVSLVLSMGAHVAARSTTDIVGEYVEARSNQVYTCGCLYSGEFGTKGKEAILAWNIREGTFRGTSLKGTKAVAVIVGDENLGSEEATLRRSILYVDNRTTSEQQRVLAGLLALEYSEILGEIIAVHIAPIVFSSDVDTIRVSIVDIVHLAVRRARLPDDAHPGSQAWYSAFIPLEDTELGTMLRYEFWGGDFGRRWRESGPEINGYLGPFRIVPEKETY